MEAKKTSGGNNGSGPKMERMQLIAKLHRLDLQRSERAVHFLLSNGISGKTAAKQGLGYDERSDCITAPVVDDKGHIMALAKVRVSDADPLDDEIPF